MPTYVDISIYDVENYADLYLGKNFKFKITYSGSEITVPMSYKDMTSKEWTLIEENEITEDSNIMAGKYLQVRFKNEFGTEIIGVFYNSAKSSKSLYDKFSQNPFLNHSMVAPAVGAHINRQ